MKKLQSKSSIYNKLKIGVVVIIAIITIGYFGSVLYSALRNGSSDINQAGIDVSTNIKSDTYLDGSKIGSSEKDNSLIYTRIDPGNHRIKIISSEDQNINYEKDIIFERATKVTIDWTFGPTQDTSSGIVKYFIKKTSDVNKIRIIPNTPDVRIKVDGNLNLDNLINADGVKHSVEITKNGYLPKTLTLQHINLQTNDPKIANDDKQKYDSYDLVVEVTLFQIPFA